MRIVNASLVCMLMLGGCCATSSSSQTAPKDPPQGPAETGPEPRTPGQADPRQPGQEPTGQEQRDEIPPPQRVAYYKGQTQLSSGDGKTPYGPPISVVVKRTVDPDAGTITESVSQLVKGKLVTHLATMRRVGKTNAFQVSDQANTYSGTLVFLGRPWAFTGWTYHLKGAEGWLVEGRAHISEAGITARKIITTPKDKLLSEEQLEQITEPEYTKHLEQMSR